MISGSQEAFSRLAEHFASPDWEDLQSEEFEHGQYKDHPSDMMVLALYSREDLDARDKYNLPPMHFLWANFSIGTVCGVGSFGWPPNACETVVPVVHFSHAYIASLKEKSGSGDLSRSMPTIFAVLDTYKR